MSISSPPSALKKFSRRLAIAGVVLSSLVSPVFSQQAPPASQNVSQKFSPENLRELLAPIALYPDALVALILPASTVPSDVVLASRFVASSGDPLQIPNQSWDNSVQSLASYPDVITWMDQNLEWTTSLGQAFIVQPQDVMSAIQQLRLQAQAAGNLVTTPQQIIVKEKTIIRIVPAEPEYLYVPQYDPEIVYVQPYAQDYGPLLTFGVGFAVGAWLNYDCDWNRQQVYYGDWQPGWDYGRRDGNRGSDDGGNVNNHVNVVNINQNTAQGWQPSSRSRQQVEQQQKNFNRSITSQDRNSSDVSDARMDQNDRNLRNVPKPSRADFGKRGSGNRNATVSARKSNPIAPEARTETPVAFNPTTPPDVAGPQGKLLRKTDKEKINPDGKRSDSQQQNGARESGQPVPVNHAPNQIGGAPATGPSKKEQSADKAAITDRMPQATKAPVVEQNGSTQSATAQPTPGGKRSSNTRASSPTQAEPVVEAPRQSTPPSSKKLDRNNTSPERFNAPAPQKEQTSQPKKSKSQVQPEQPQQSYQAPAKSKSERKEKKSTPAPQQEPQQKLQPQEKQQPDSGEKSQEKKSEPSSSKPAKGQKSAEEEEEKDKKGKKD